MWVCRILKRERKERGSHTKRKERVLRGSRLVKRKIAKRERERERELCMEKKKERRVQSVTVFKRDN